jgi:hypothetical protein
MIIRNVLVLLYVLSMRDPNRMRAVSTTYDQLNIYIG